MGRSALLIPALLLVSVLGGCVGQQKAVQEASPPFVFRSLDLNQRRQDGLRDWDLSSPEARYDLSSRTVRALRPSGVLYKNDQPSFRISAELATVLNDGEMVILEGQVQLQQLNDQTVLIRGDRLVWNPAQSRMVIDQNAEALDASSQLTAKRLTLIQTSNTLRFEGPTQLLRWTEGRRPDVAADTNILASNGRWNLETGDLDVHSPVRALHSKDLDITASALHGNTQQGFLDLIQPVRLEQLDGEIDAGTTRWDLAEQRLTSNALFQGRRQDAAARGQGFVIDEETMTFLILKACQLTQPGVTLTAHRCSWNWVSNRVVADGNVVLRNQDHEHETRAPRLEGQLGSSEGVRFGSTGQRVRSSIRFTPDPPRSKHSSSRSRVSF
ncbi:MAG: LPS export ABC transporter periplasmic protein LptC [Cyanobacteriota bacterium]|nr:LPS export ABC transporter periplasmic protein LptC [Cyanobacteriota bacterium]